MDDSKTPPPVVAPTDVGGMSIHLSYIRRDIDEIKGGIKDLKNSYVSRVDFDEHLKIDEDHEERLRTIEQSMWKYIGYSSAISSFVGIGGAFLIQYLTR